MSTRRAFKVNFSGAVEWQDEGEGTITSVSTGTGLRQITMPQKYVGEYAVFLTAFQNASGGVSTTPLGMFCSQKNINTFVTHTQNSSTDVVANQAFMCEVIGDIDETPRPTWTSNNVTGSFDVQAEVDFGPLSPVAGDLLFAIYCWDDAGSNVGAPPAGWTSIYNYTGTSYPSVHVYRKVSDGTEGVVPYGGTQPVSAYCGTAVRGTGLATSYADHQVNTSTLGDPILPSVSTQVAGEQVLCIPAAEDDDAFFTIPSGVETLMNDKATDGTARAILAVYIYDTVSNNETPPQVEWTGSDGNTAITIRLSNP